MRISNFRCQVHGAPKLDPFAVLDRRTTRFMGKGAAWNYVAMQEAIELAGLEERISRTRVPASSWALAVPPPAPWSRPPTSRAKGAQAHRALGRAQGDELHGVTPPSPRPSASRASITTHKLRLRDVQAHRIGAGYEQIQWGKQDIVFAGGHEDLDWSLSNLFDAMGAMSTDFNATPEVASRAYDAKRDGFVDRWWRRCRRARRTRACQGARRHHRCRTRRLWRHLRRLRHGRLGEGAIRCMQQALATVKGKVDYINPHATSTPVGDMKEMEAIRDRVRYGRRLPAAFGDQVAHRALAGRHRRAGIDLLACRR